MSDLMEFLKARLSEDEQTARSCPRPTWTVIGPPTGHYAYSSTSDSLCAQSGKTSWQDIAKSTMWTGRSLLHAARHDPARVLREVEAKRRVVAEHALNGWVCNTCDNGEVEQVFPCPTLRLLAMPYADHFDYREEWRP